MAGHAPRLLHDDALNGRAHWLDTLSDLRISLYMLILAAVAAALVLALDRRFFG
ncbi:MAG: hypothetical protein ACE5F9_03415 [Phycisphaerae bacterium]